MDDVLNLQKFENSEELEMDKKGKTFTITAFLSTISSNC
ncbi:class III lanthipeptide [Staphylococcus hominis]|nr:class III lanthipeptide [Staphylococcus hominis]